MADLEAFGAPPEEIARIAAQARAADEDDDDLFPVWERNWPAVMLFVACATQWRRVAVVGFGGGAVVWEGLDYSAVKAAGDMDGVEWPAPDLFADVRRMEAAAVRELNRR